MDLSDAIAALDKAVPDPNDGLPDEVFYFISRNTPLVNVDLLIKDESGRTLLAWRDDPYSGTGWHIPGGIIRFKENMETRIKKVALSEIGVEVRYKKTPIAFNELIHPEFNNRSHFISFLYECFLDSSFVPQNRGLTEKSVGFLKWHAACPENLIKYHNFYRKYL